MCRGSLASSLVAARFAKANDAHKALIMSLRTSPVYGSLAITQTIMGVEQRLFLVSVIYAAFCFLVLKNLWLMVGVFPLHIVFRSLTKSDPDLLSVYAVYRFHGERYSPLLRACHAKQNLRPEGFGRQLPF
jgi:type IV secretory pathway VirB3-like protein